MRVGMLPNGPLEGRPGFGSHVSNWLGAPHSQSSKQRLCAFLAAAAKAAFSNNPEKLVTAAAVPPVNPFRNSRRCSRCSSTRQLPSAEARPSGGVGALMGW